MPHHDEPWQRHQRERWLRPDAHLWIRPDAANFYAPGTDLADVFPALARKRDAENAAAAAEIAREHEWLLALRDELMKVKAELARRRLEETKYSPSQPRVPAGNPRGGQWTDRSGGQSTVASPSLDTGQSQDADITLPMGNVDIGDLAGSSELGDLFQIKPSDARVDGVQVAGDGRPVDLLEEEQRGGHTIAGHVGNDVRSNAESATKKGDTFEDFRSGSFTSLEAANKLVNATISANQGKVDQVVIGGSPKQELDHDHDFPTPTGSEAYMRNERSQAVIRDTYSVRVVIVPDSSEKGYRVLTAFPRNR